MTRAEIQAVLFVAVAMLAGALVLLAKQYNSDFLPDLGPAPAGARQNAGLRPESAAAFGTGMAGTDMTGTGRSSKTAASGGNLAASGGNLAASGGNLAASGGNLAASDGNLAASGGNLAASGGNLKVPVNTAPASELEKLPGIGPKLAGAIIAYRKQSGHFASVEQLLEVKGIGPAKLGRMRPFVELK